MCLLTNKKIHIISYQKIMMLYLANGVITRPSCFIFPKRTASVQFNILSGSMHLYNIRKVLSRNLFGGILNHSSLLSVSSDGPLIKTEKCIITYIISYCSQEVKYQFLYQMNKNCIDKSSSVTLVKKEQRAPEDTSRLRPIS